MGGDIWVESCEGEGLNFYFIFIVICQVGVEEVLQDVDCFVVDVVDVYQDLCILFVDDVVINCIVVKNLMVMIGVEIVEVENGV